MKKSNLVAFVVGLCMFAIFVIFVNGYWDEMLLIALCFLVYGIGSDLLDDGRIICILLPPFYGFIITAILLPIKYRLA